MNKTLLGVIAVAVVVLIGGVYAYTSRTPTSVEGGMAGKDTPADQSAPAPGDGEKDMVKSEEGDGVGEAPAEPMAKAPSEPVENKPMADKPTTDKPTAGEVMSKSGTYEAYAPEKLSNAETGDVVLFFHASWCPSCRGLNGDIEKNASAIPSGVTILKTDYDSETALKKKYGVTTQHTLVQVDKDGNQIKKWSGSANLHALLSQLQ